MQAAAQQIAELVEFPDWLMLAIADHTTCLFGSSVEAFGAVLKTALPGPMAWLADWRATHVHPHSAKLPLMHPEGVVFAAVFYLVVIAALYPIGQALGKLTLKNFSLVHNFFLFALSLYMWFGITITAVASGFSLWNNDIVGAADPNGWRMAKLIWVFYVSKLPEFIDTVIMMLKQNYRQVSFLHLYHHGTIFVIWFFVTLEGPGGDAYWSAQCNSLVHVFMYGYYFFTAFAGETGPLRNFLNSIKFVITKGQMTQFAMNALQSGYLLFIASTCNYPRHLIQLLFYYMFTLLALFGNFLIKNQALAAKEKKEKKAAAAAAGATGVERKSGSIEQQTVAAVEEESVKARKSRSKKE